MILSVQSREDRRCFSNECSIELRFVECLRSLTIDDWQSVWMCDGDMVRGDSHECAVFLRVTDETLIVGEGGDRPTW